ncbi:hypothetical protein [Domibacillus mangrovi]|uniref:PIN domain-containing protein n=1 Tax=Domibacillus mangrovi TaxID=1714354 RepID=A0A1Q5P391_9BACI|nr:hypothetical protein [Domibacillus mangrovi]OKL36696.1 hypothetical protein BLL40_08130 [Domibacillus mangrovi]
MPVKILRIEDLNYNSFKQASIYVDACFLLAFLDANGDEDGELVERVLIKMQNDNIKKLLISNHVFSEVVQHLFLGHIYSVIHLAYRKFVLKKDLSADEKDVLGDPFIARKLMQLVDQQELRGFRTGNKVFIPVKETIKLYKERYTDRDSLNYYYESVLQIFNDLFSNLNNEFNIQTEHVSSDESTFYMAQVFMSELQLEVKDSLHLAVAKQNEADYFATLDSDFVHKFYSGAHLDKTTIFHISKRYV